MGIATSTSATNLQRALLTLESYQGITLQFGAYSRTFRYDDRKPSTIDILKSFKEFEANPYTSAQLITAHQEGNALEYGYRLDDRGNTYNWGAQLSHDINWHRYTKNNKYYYIVAVHYGVDVRSGYTCDIVLQFERPLEFFEIIDAHEISYVESANGRNYFVTVQPLIETITVEDVETGAIFEMFSVDDLEETTKKKEEIK